MLSLIRPSRSARKRFDPFWSKSRIVLQADAIIACAFASIFVDGLTTMNSVQQTILGLVLVGIAFIFGSYLHRDGDTQVVGRLGPDTENLQWQNQSNEGQDLDAKGDTKQAMPNMNAAQSSMPNLVEANLVPDLETAPRVEDRPLEVVEPDFSRFAINDSSTDSAGPAPIETSNRSSFDSHFPQPITGTVENIQPKMPKRDTGANTGSSPMEVTVTPKRLNLDSSSPSTSVLENKAAEVQPQSIQNNYYRDVQTQTEVVAIRPRNNSPVMAETQEYKDHQTVAGETLQDLAIKYFGDPAYYLDIYVANKNVLQNPSELPAGTLLKIPVYK